MTDLANNHSSTLPAAREDVDQLSVTSSRAASFTVPTLSKEEGDATANCLQEQLVSLSQLALTLKHVHWNVVGPNFMAIHAMLDPQYEAVGHMVDDLAERIAALGHVPNALPSALVDQSQRDEYPLARADAIAHMGALDLTYQQVITSLRSGINEVGELDAMSEDLLVGQTRELERFHWFVRSHLADWAGGMADAGASSAMQAAQSVAVKGKRDQ